MRGFMNRTFAVGMLAALPLALVTADAKAQDEAAEQEVCTAQLTPAQVQAGSPSVAIQAHFSTDIGEVRDLEAPEGSGLAYSEPDPAAEQDVAVEGEDPGAEELAETGARTVWINAESAQPGTYQITLKGDGGSCTADLEVLGAVPESGMEGEGDAGYGN